MHPAKPRPPWSCDSNFPRAIALRLSKKTRIARIRVPDISAATLCSWHSLRLAERLVVPLIRIFESNALRESAGFNEGEEYEGEQRYHSSARYSRCRCASFHAGPRRPQARRAAGRAILPPFPERVAAREEVASGREQRARSPRRTPANALRDSLPSFDELPARDAGGVSAWQNDRRASERML
jgi:hypothetical protein